MNPYAVESFEQFWPAYVRMHSHPATQWLHALATSTALGMIATGLWRRSPAWVLLAPLVDHLIAQLAHRGVQGNVTQPWRHPYWHLRGELRLARLVLLGRMRGETARHVSA